MGVHCPVPVCMVKTGTSSLLLDELGNANLYFKFRVCASSMTAAFGRHPMKKRFVNRHVQF